MRLAVLLESLPGAPAEAPARAWLPGRTRLRNGLIMHLALSAYRKSSDGRWRIISWLVPLVMVRRSGGERLLEGLRA
jgi:hypothetical protein